MTEKRRRRVVVWGVLCVVLLLCAAGIWWWAKPKGTHVEIYTVKRQTIQNKVFASGVVKPAERQVVTQTELPGPVSQVKVHVNQLVNKGDVLLVCQNQTQLAALQSARVSLNQAKATLGTAQAEYDAAPPGLQSQFIGSLSSARSSVAEANAQLQQAQAAYDATVIRATMDGVVISVDPDGIAPDGTESASIVEVASRSKVVLISLSEVDAVHIQNGYHASLESDPYPNQTWTGTVTQVSPFASENSAGTGQVQVTIGTPSQFPVPYGYDVTVNILSATHNQVPVVPYDALVQNGDQYTVFVYKNGTVHQVPVTLGITTDTAVEVTKGLQSGAQVVMNPPETLSDGEAVVPS